MKYTSKKMAKLHYNAMRDLDKIQCNMYELRRECMEDRRFYSIAGAMWEGDNGKWLKQYENKPRLEVNKIHLAVMRIISEQRKNRVSVKFLPKDGVDDGLSDTAAGLFRADEQDSCAEEAYDNAFEEGIGGGMGAIRLRCDYEDESDEENETQRIRIEPIYDADASVFFDLSAQRQDKSDARYCFVLTPMSKDDYDAEYGDKDVNGDSEDGDDDYDSVTPVDKYVNTSEFDWFADDMVYIAEYYQVVNVGSKISTYEGIDGTKKKYTSEELEDDALVEELEATGFTLRNVRHIKKKRVRKYLLSGDRVLEDCGYIAGDSIPIVPYYGKRWYINGVERCMGHVRLCKDAQRLKNMQLSQLAQLASLGSVEKPILTPEQIVGHTQMWSDDNIENYAYLLINPVTDINGQQSPIPPLGYTKSPAIPQAMAALLQTAEQDIKDILGNQEVSESLPDRTSGVAMELVQGKIDMQSYIYMSNLEKCIKRVGEVWLGMWKDILVEEGRKSKYVGDMGDVSTVELRQPIVKGDTGEMTYKNDLSNAKLDVVAKMGASTVSKRESTVRSLMGILNITQDPETIQVIISIILTNLEGEGLDELRKFYRQKLIRMGVLKPNEEEAAILAAEAQNAQPDPQAEYLKAAASQAEAEAASARADTVLTVAKSGETKAKTGKLIAETNSIVHG